MTKSILFSAEEAERINVEVQKIKSSLFVFCNYNPGPIIPRSPDARFLVGVLNLYKLVIDAGIIRGIEKTAQNMKIHLRYPLGKIIGEANLLRSAIAHNFMVHNDTNQCAREFHAWVLQIIGKASFENAADYEKAFNKIEQLVERLTCSLREFLELAVKPSNRGTATELLENAILEFYSRNSVGNNIIKQQMKEMQYAYLSQHMGIDANYRQIMNIRCNNFTIANWAKNFCLCEPMGKLRLLDELMKSQRNLSNKALNSIRIKQECSKAAMKQINEEIAKDLGVNVKDLNEFSYLEYYMRGVMCKVKEKLKMPRPASLLPQGILQEIIAADMEKVPISDDLQC